MKKQAKKKPKWKFGYLDLLPQDMLDQMAMGDENCAVNVFVTVLAQRLADLIGKLHSLNCCDVFALELVEITPEYMIVTGEASTIEFFERYHVLEGWKPEDNV